MRLDEISSELLQRAISIYLQRAYQEGETIPESVRGRAASIPPGLHGEALLERDVFERLPAGAAVAEATRFNLRLGNAAYLHMKLGVDRVSGTQEFVLVVDTHDKHFAALVRGGEQDQYQALVDQNAKVKEAIESAWSEAGLPTFQGYLRQRLRSMKERGNDPCGREGRG